MVTIETIDSVKVYWCSSNMVRQYDRIAFPGNRTLAGNWIVTLIQSHYSKGERLDIEPAFLRFYMVNYETGKRRSVLIHWRAKVSLVDSTFLM